jgi:RHS repeat-associated protein
VSVPYSVRVALGPGGGWSEPDGTIPGGASLSSDPPPPATDPTNPSYAPGPGYAGAAIADAAPGDQPPADTGNGGGGSVPPDLPSAHNVTYNLDKAGNRTSLTDTMVGTTNYTQTAGNLNEYAQVGSDSVGNGNEHQIAAYQAVNYSYINDTHLVGVSSVGNNYALAYDALGRCVKRTLNGATTYYIYDGEKPIQEIGPVWASNIYGIGVDEPVIRFLSSNVYYFYQDHEGSVTHVRNNPNGGTLVERYRYDAFGKPTIMDGNWTVRTQSAIGNRFMFTGREWAPGNLGFYEYRARAYHPGLGRFISEDPKLFDAGDYNLFRYCHNDPEDLTDSMGLLPDSAYVGQLTPERVNDILYNQSMAAAQWAGSNLMHGGAGAIAIGGAGYEAYSGLSKVIGSQQSSAKQHTSGSGANRPGKMEILENRTTDYGNWITKDYQLETADGRKIDGGYSVAEHTKYLYTKDMGTQDTDNRYHYLSGGIFRDQVGIRGVRPPKSFSADVREQTFTYLPGHVEGYTSRQGTSLPTVFLHVTVARDYHAWNTVIDVTPGN